MKFILDTNIWISFLLKKADKEYLLLLLSQGHTLFSSPALVKEILDVCSRPKIRKSITPEDVDALLSLIKQLSVSLDPPKKHEFSRDLKDGFLLDMCALSEPNYLVTGDKALLELGTFQKTAIISLKYFRDLLEQ